MKNLSMLLALSVLLFTACSNDESEKLKKENEALRNEIEQLGHGRSLKGMDEEMFALKEMPIETLKTSITRFQKEEDIKIPSAWVFEEPQLITMLGHESTTNKIVGLMAYPIKDSNGFLKIALVPYYEIDEDPNKKMHFDNVEASLKAYDFSDICPLEGGITTKCVSNAVQLFGAGTVIYNYHK